MKDPKTMGENVKNTAISEAKYRIIEERKRSSNPEGNIGIKLKQEAVHSLTPRNYFCLTSVKYAFNANILQILQGV